MVSEQTLVKTWERLAPMSKPSHLSPEFGARLNGAVQPPVSEPTYPAPESRNSSFP